MIFGVQRSPYEVRPWYAWYPVRTLDNRWAWLEVIQACFYRTPEGRRVWQYEIPTEDNGHT